ncbi:hypothetical protein M011DRAFT_138522 [Sporormia fimetaria CBS 119925]|uniref:Uncharacterized protein n=1 Tax=Sporormia fimetaria CBS 119925 TaxID=1340428 RepID=A0A6A6V7N2_9PLEO|nr:hypothetical protein M011DRAFT_138522 [Sporormia fimetaria CBS 119925]
MSQTRVPEGARKYKEESGPGAPQKLQHHPHPSQQHPSQGLPPPAHHQHQHQHQQHHTQHHPRPVSSLQHPPHPDSPHQNQPNQSPAQAHYSSPHPANSAVPQQHPSPYVQQVQGAGGQTQQEVPYYTTHASPYTNNNAPNAYSAAGEYPFCSYILHVTLQPM